MSILFGKDKKQKKFMKKRFEQFIGDHSASDEIKLAPESTIKKIAIVVINLRNYTELCSKLELSEVGSIINEYYTIVSNIYSKYGCSFDFIGNKVFALFGVPLTDINDTRYALESSAKIIEDIAKLNCRLSQDNNLPLMVTIGINSGDALVGLFGSGQRLTYTAFGKNVDIAFRNSKIGDNQKIYVSEHFFEEGKEYINALSIKVNSVTDPNDNNIPIKELCV